MANFKQDNVKRFIENISKEVADNAYNGGGRGELAFQGTPQIKVNWNTCIEGMKKCYGFSGSETLAEIASTHPNLNSMELILMFEGNKNIGVAIDTSRYLKLKFLKNTNNWTINLYNYTNYNFYISGAIAVLDPSTVLSNAFSTIQDTIINTNIPEAAIRNEFFTTFSWFDVTPIEEESNIEVNNEDNVI